MDTSKVELRKKEDGFGVFAATKIYAGTLLMVNSALCSHKYIGTSTIDKIIDILDKYQRNNP